MANSKKGSIASGLLLIGGFITAGLAGFLVRGAQDLPQTVQEEGIGVLLASRSDRIDIGEMDYYREVVQLLQDQYVEADVKEEKLLSGAVRGMIASLRDPDSQFFGPEEFAAFKKMRQGVFEGIGVILAMEGGTELKANAEETMTPDQMANLKLPRLTVVSIAPNGPAAKAGVKVGDKVTEIDGHWVVNTELLLKFRKAQADYLSKKLAPEKYFELRKDLRNKTEKSILPARVKEKLTVGLKGSHEVVWERAGKTFVTKLEKGPSSFDPVAKTDLGVAIRFGSDTAKLLKEQIEKGNLTFDLRNNALGDFSTVPTALAVVAPKGVFGYRKDEKGSEPIRFELKSGAQKPVKLKLIVDDSTRDAAAIFAVSLARKGLATLVGTPHKRQVVSETVQLPDGSGYTLDIGDFVAGAPPKVAKSTTIKGAQS